MKTQYRQQNNLLTGSKHWETHKLLECRLSPHFYGWQTRGDLARGGFLHWTCGWQGIFGRDARNVCLLQTLPVCVRWDKALLLCLHHCEIVHVCMRFLFVTNCWLCCVLASLKLTGLASWHADVCLITCVSGTVEKILKKKKMKLSGVTFLKHKCLHSY